MLTVLIQNLSVSHDFASKCIEFLHASLYRCSLKDKLSLDFSHYIWKSVVGVGGIPLFVNFFSLLIVSEYYLKYWKCAICDGIHWHFVEMTKSRVVCEKTLFGVLEMHYKVCFSFSWFYLFAYQCLFLCATCLHSEHLHFASKSVEFFNASLNRWSVKDKLTLDLSHYIWKIVVGVGDISCCKFFLIV